jgi:ABC-2 type transport system permease protein
MRDMLNAFTSFLIRVSAFVSKEFFTMISQPRLLGVLILGPFLILLIFGISYRDIYRTLRTIVVVPENKTIAASVESLAKQPIPGVKVVEVTKNASGALSALKNRVVDLVMVVPDNAFQKIEQNQQAVFSFYHDEIDPYEVAYMRIITRQITEETNRALMLAAVEQSKAEARKYQSEIHTLQGRQDSASAGNNQPAQPSSPDNPLPGVDVLWFLMQAASGQPLVPPAGGNGKPAVSPTDQAGPGGSLNPDLTQLDKQLSRFLQTDSQVIVEPFRRETQPLNQTAIEPVHFYVPVVLALLLQHIAISLAGLSIVSERFAGTMELMRAAPVNAFEVLLGKYFSFLVFIGLLTAILTAMVHWLLGVPLLGSLWLYALAVLLLIFAALGLGFLISSFANSDSQAIQFAMVWLLASIFFSGFFLPLYRLWWPAQTVSWAMPATYGIKIFEDIMLRGVQPEMWMLWVLAGAGLILFLVNWLRLHSLMVRN